MTEEINPPAESLDFIREKIAANLPNRAVVTRFPPEPNGYLHIGHAKAVCLDFGVAQEFGGRCHLRMDDTNPAKENYEYVNAIVEDIKWLGFDFGEHLYYASDYFDRMYECAETLIKKGLAYVCDLTPEEWLEYRGNSEVPGKDSPGRARSVEENLDLFRRMRNGEFEDGSMVLRGRIDMQSPNIHMRDPVFYRIMHAHHFRQEDKWCIYPMYDYAHCLEDAFEGVTYSLCTLEFEIHRPLYDWVLQALDWKNPPEQTEFSRMNLSYTVMSKRKLLQLVREKHVAGWDDPRMPTICGLRRRGCLPESLRRFSRELGITKINSVTDLGVLERCMREDLNRVADRFLAVLDPVRVVLDNYPEDRVELLDAVNNPEDPASAHREVPFGRELLIERADFMEEPVKGYFRLAPGREVRLRYGYFITCTSVEKDAGGKVTAIHCTYDPETRGGNAPDGRKVKGTIHWVHAPSAVQAEVRLYDRLFTVEAPGEGDVDFLTQLNADSLSVTTGYLEPALAACDKTRHVQFERLGYFFQDKESAAGKLVFNRTVTLKDSWAKQQVK